MQAKEIIKNENSLIILPSSHKTLKYNKTYEIKLKKETHRIAPIIITCGYLSSLAKAIITTFKT